MRSHWKVNARIVAQSCLLASGAVFLLAGLAIAQGQLVGKPLTTDPANDLRPAWSPDGAQVAFHSSRGGSNDIWVMDGEGGNQHALTTGPADDRRPAWRPDGEWIAFDSDRNGTRDLWAVEVSSGNIVQLTDGAGHETFAAWSPDGTEIAYFSYEGGVLDLWKVPAQAILDGAEAAPTQVVSGLADERKNQCTFACHSPAWSPDGGQLAYMGENHTRIWLVGSDGSDPRLVSAGGDHEHFPMWTSDGRIMFLSEHVNNRQEPVNDIWVMDASGEDAELLFGDIPHGGPFEFKADGKTVVFHSPRAGNFDIYSTVLGESAAVVVQPATEPAAPAATEVASVVTAPAAVPTAAVAPSAAPGRAYLGVAAAAAIAVLGGGLAAFWLIRRGRTS